MGCRALEVVVGSAALFAAQGVSAQASANQPVPLTAVAASAPVAAAASAPVARAAATSQDTTQLDAVVVTAQKRSEFAKDVPSSIAVLNGAALEHQGANKLEDYVQRVPGLTLNAQSLGQQELTIRGISTGAGYAPTVAVYIDDAPFGSSTGDGAGGLITPDVDSIDLDRIEVLRGPQGTLYGASNIGGLIKYVTIAPDPGYFSTSFGTDGTAFSHGSQGYSLRGRVNAPVIQDQLAVLATAYYRKDPGFVDDAGRGLKNVDKDSVSGGRLATLWNPFRALTVKFEAIAQNRRADGSPTIDADPQTLKPIYGDYEQRRAADSEYYRSKMRQFILSGTYDLGAAQLTSATSYSTLHHQGGEDFTQAFGPIASGFGPQFDVPNLGFSVTDDILQKKFSQEVRLAGKFWTLFDWIGGVYYTHEASDTAVGLPALDSVTGAPIATPALLVSDINTVYKEYAGYGELTYHATSALDFIAGLRDAHNSQSHVTTSSGLLLGPDSVVPATSSDNSTTFDFAPRYKFSENLMTYGRIATGYRPGGVNGGYSPAPTFGPDRVTNYELGAKMSAPEQRAALNLAVFLIDWKKIQLQETTDQGLGFVDNAGRARSQGVEIGASYVPLSGLNLGASASYTEATLREDIPSGVYGLKGDALPFSPKWKTAATADYNFTVLDGRRAFVGGGVFYTDKVQAGFASSSASPRISLPSYTTLDLRTGLIFDQFRITAYVKNVADKRGYNGTEALTLDPSGPVRLSLIQPRTIGLQLTGDF